MPCMMQTYNGGRCWWTDFVPEAIHNPVAFKLQGSGLLTGWLCFTSHRKRGHLETAPPFTVACEGRTYMLCISVFKP